MAKNRNILTFWQELKATFFIYSTSLIFGIIGTTINFVLGKKYDHFWTLITSSMIGVLIGMIILRLFIKFKCKACNEKTVFIKAFLFTQKAKCTNCKTENKIDIDY